MGPPMITCMQWLSQVLLQAGTRPEIYWSYRNGHILSICSLIYIIISLIFLLILLFLYSVMFVLRSQLGPYSNAVKSNVVFNESKENPDLALVQRILNQCWCTFSYWVITVGWPQKYECLSVCVCVLTSKLNLYVNSDVKFRVSILRFIMYLQTWLSH